jgi:hypothetical protein
MTLKEYATLSVFWGWGRLNFHLFGKYRNKKELEICKPIEIFI